MALEWFLRVLLNSSSFSWIFLSISCLTWPSSSWARRTLFSSCSSAASASSRAAWSSSFSTSSLRRCLSSSWMERPPSPNWSSKSLTSSAKFLFSRRTISSCSLDSSRAALMRNLSALKLRHSELHASSSAIRSSAFAFHSPTTLSKFLPRFSVIIAAAWVRSYSMESSSSSASILDLDFSEEAILALRLSMTSSASWTREASLFLPPSSSSMRPRASTSYLDFHSWISAWALDRARRASFFFSDSSSMRIRRFSASVIKFLYLVIRLARSLASASPSLLVSSSWVVREILFFCRAAMAFSVSSIWRVRSWDSTCSFFLVLSASLRARAISSSFWLASTMRPWVILQVSLHASLVLLGLGLVLVDGVNLLAQLSHAVVVLLPESSQSSLVADVGLLEVGLQLGQLALTLLVQLNLESGVGASLLQPGANVFQVPGEKSPVLLGLSAVTTLNIDLLIELVNTDLQLLDLLAVLAAKGLLVLNLGSNGGDLLLPALDALAELGDGSLEVGDSLLSELEVSLNLALHLLGITLGLLFPLKSILALVKGL